VHEIQLNSLDLVDDGATHFGARRWPPLMLFIFNAFA